MKISFLDFWDGFDIDNNFFLHSLRMLCDVQVTTDPEKADLIIFSCFGNSNQNFMTKKRIFYTGENLRPNFQSILPIRQGNFLVQRCDFALSFDFTEDERNIRLPLWMLQIDWFGKVNYTNPQFTIGLGNIMNNDYYKKKKNKFCSIVFNSTSPHRYEMIKELSKYKKVDCFGKPFGNWFYGENVKIENISNYKFNICFENSLYPGYYTEKPIHAKVAGCVPIYWSDKMMSLDFNENAFINLLDFDNDVTKLSEYIIELDKEEKLYEEIRNQPIFNENQEPPKAFEIFLKKLNNII